MVFIVGKDRVAQGVFGHSHREGGDAITLCMMNMRQVNFYIA